MFDEKEKGLVIGPSHDDGGVVTLLQPFDFPVEIEGQEYVLCRQVLNSPKKHKFKNKTNKEILDRLYTQSRCSLSDRGTYVNDFVVCKMTVNDDKRRDYQGTAAEILSIMQNEHGCRIAQGVKLANGVIKPGQEVEMLNSDRWDKKKAHIEQLAGSFKKLRNNITRDLKGDDEKNKRIAAVISLMDNTAERVGNKDSEDNGHFGVTGFQKKAYYH